MHRPFRFRRAAIVAAGAALLLAGGAGASAAGGPQPGTGEKGPAIAAAALTNPLVLPGSELQFIAVAPCRILDTRVAGPALTGQRNFDATLASYAAQGGTAGTCNIPDVAMSVELNLGAISQKNSTSWLTGWAAGTPMPSASLLNYTPAGPIANMVTMPLNATGGFSLRTPATAHVFADVAGYYVKPLYASIDGRGVAVPYFDVQSGLVSSERLSAGRYTLTFDRNVTNCVPAISDGLFAAPHEMSADSLFSGDSTVFVSVNNIATGEPEDTVFHLSLTC